MRSRNKKAGVASLYSLDSTISNPAVEQRSVTMSNTAPNWEACERAKEKKENKKDDDKIMITLSNVEIGKTSTAKKNPQARTRQNKSGLEGGVRG